MFRDSKEFVDGVDDAVGGVLVQLLQNNIKLLNVEYCKKMNEWIRFTTMRCVFVRFLEEIEDTQKNLSKLPDL